ncbi:hypothetical protein ABIB58_002873 [Brevundimonas sp. UYEF29]|uniref:hypothetical protein n=1 Tax=Brevundimonas sp. UYEF29 TaxID=3156346 RepID=UPI003397EC31
MEPAKIAAVFGSANAMGLHATLSKLIEKKVLTAQEGADVLVTTARRIREGTEDDEKAKLGEGIAQHYERLAGWLLGYGLQGDEGSP